MVASTYDVLPSKTNLARWGFESAVQCSRCHKGIANLEHVLSSCSSSLQQYTRRHNEVLKVLHDTIGGQLEKAKTAQGQGWLSKQQDWKVTVDLDGQGRFPRQIVETGQRPDMVVWSEEGRIVEIIELTVPWETRMSAEHERKLSKYTGLREECIEKGWKCTVSAVEVGCRGFVGKEVGRVLRRLGLGPREIKSVKVRLEEKAESASSWIFRSSKEQEEGRKW